METYLKTVSNSQLLEGIVLRAVSGVYVVQSQEMTYQCSLRGNLKKEFTYNTSLSSNRRVTQAKRPHTRDTISVGDRVQFQPESDTAGVIEAALPRTTRFARSGFRGEEHTLVCNIDLIVIVFACEDPRPDPWKLDRFLVTAELQSIEPLIIGNKIDKVSEKDFTEIFAEWRNVGYKVIGSSAKLGIGIEEIRQQLKGKVSAFVGPSGVGKSSLLNAVQQGLKLRTTEVGEVTHKGKHTTTAAQLIPLDIGGWVADTPGLRQLDLIETDREIIIECFPELNELSGMCRFDNCRHDSEPGCALKAAVEKGSISERRFESFMEMSG